MIDYANLSYSALKAQPNGPVKKFWLIKNYRTALVALADRDIRELGCDQLVALLDRYIEEEGSV